VEVKYRVVEEVTPKGDWEIAGVIALWPEEPSYMQLRSMLEHTVSRPIWGKIRQRVKEQCLTLETYHEALEDYERYYRIHPEIRTIRANTAAEIRHRLREKYIFLREPVTPA
jgi:hypothetical protein